MTHHGSPGHADLHGSAPHEVPTGVLPYSESEWQTFREEDKMAGTRIVGLMVGIFLVGLVLYIGVAISVATRAVS
jgi:hypothetical protein